jgi:hypothetical protein
MGGNGDGRDVCDYPNSPEWIIAAVDRRTIATESQTGKGRRMAGRQLWTNDQRRVPSVHTEFAYVKRVRGGKLTPEPKRRRQNMESPKAVRRERSAQEKMRLIASLLIPGLDRKQVVHTMKQIEAREDVSIRSLKRYITFYNVNTVKRVAKSKRGRP